MNDEIEKFVRDHEICYDRFTFDKIFRFLLENDFEHEDAKDYILCNCSLSAIIFQERLENDFYKTISIEDSVSQDLLDLKEQMLNNIIKNN